MTKIAHTLSIRVYYEDTDFSGVVYHANYLRYLERGRTEFLRDLGIEQASLRDESGGSLAFVVRHMALDFIKPAHMDDRVIVETCPGILGGASLLLDHRIIRREDVLVRAKVKVALVTAGRPRRFPARLAALLAGRNAPASSDEAC
jgi:acyl-CoA thioester hydrolase